MGTEDWQSVCGCDWGSGSSLGDTGEVEEVTSHITLGGEEKVCSSLLLLDSDTEWQIASKVIQYRNRRIKNTDQLWKSRLTVYDSRNGTWWWVI